MNKIAALSTFIILISVQSFSGTYLTIIVSNPGDSCDTRHFEPPGLLHIDTLLANSTAFYRGDTGIHNDYYLARGHFRFCNPKDKIRFEEKLIEILKADSLKQGLSIYQQCYDLASKEFEKKLHDELNKSLSSVSRKRIEKAYTVVKDFRQGKFITIK